MNKERVLAVADLIEKGHHKFNGIHAKFEMSDWIEPMFEDKTDPDPFKCNTSACIAGFTCLLFDYENASNEVVQYGRPRKHYNVEFKAAELLDLDSPDSSNLFFGGKARADTAAKVLRDFAETGIVDWGTARETTNDHNY